MAKILPLAAKLGTCLLYTSAGKGSTVYIMSSGGKYHTLQDCKAIMAYVRAVKLKEVKYLGACSYCGG